jgi:3',5'-cyclic AMP phosphodiesterase CpdA
MPLEHNRSARATADDTRDASAFCLAHISDLHVLDLHGTPPWRFLNKRITGLGNLVGPRRGAHPAFVADGLVDRLAALAPDHIAFTGDLTNLALPSEFRAGVALLARLGDGDALSAIPGNHDAYTGGAVRSARGERAISAWAGGTTGRADYPFVKAPRPWLRIYGLSSAIAAPPMIAWGQVGAAQLDRLQAAVAAEGPEVKVRIAMVHHNLHRRGPLAQLTSSLRDGDALAATLVRLGFDAVLHGHTHAPHLAHLGDDPCGVLVLGCGSSTWYRPGHGQWAHFNLLTLDPGGIRAIRSEVWDNDARSFRPARDDLLDVARRTPLAQ